MSDYCENPGCTVHDPFGNRLARILVWELGGTAPAIQYARRVAAQNGVDADAYWEAAEAIARKVTEQPEPQP